MSIIGLVLAAGLSRRMGQPKQLLPWGKATVLGQVLHHVQTSNLDGAYVVTGHEATAVSTIARTHNLPTIHNPHYAQGMLTSLQAGVAAMLEEMASVTAVLVLLADQPMLSSDVINRVLTAQPITSEVLARPVDESGRVGHPVLIGRAYFAELLALPPEATPRHLLKNHPVHLVTVTTSAIYQDIDTPEAYQQAVKQYENQKEST